MEFPKDLKILLAEDNKINQRLVSLIFRKLDVAFDIASNGQEAVGMYHEKSYDLILMDLQMPVMDGLESSRRIRSFERESANNHRSVIIALSASESSDKIKQCFDAGMDDFMEKPFQADKLIELVVRFF